MAKYLLVAYLGDRRLVGSNKPTTKARAETEKVRWETHAIPLNRFRTAHGQTPYRYAVEPVEG